MTAISSMDLSVYSDLFKDVNGFRPRGQLLEFTSVEDYNQTMHQLSQELDEQMEYEARMEDEAVLRLENRIHNMMESFDIDRATAFRWDLQSFDTEDIGFYLYLNGILSFDNSRPYEYEIREYVA